MCKEPPLIQFPNVPLLTYIIYFKDNLLQTSASCYLLNIESLQNMNNMGHRNNQKLKVEMTRNKILNLIA